MPSKSGDETHYITSLKTFIRTADIRKNRRLVELIPTETVLDLFFLVGFGILLTLNKSLEKSECTKCVFTEEVQQKCYLIF